MLSPKRTFSLQRVCKHFIAVSAAFLSLTSGQNLASDFNKECVQDVNCHLPDCFCANNTQGPLTVAAQNRPQIVALSFSDAVNERNFGYYIEMLRSGWKNSNGCPVSLTLFVPDPWTNYTMVQKLWLEGAEIASFGKSGYSQSSYHYKTLSRELLEEEIGGQKDNFVIKAKIPPDAIKGFRMPYFESGSDEMLDVLKEEGYTYDSTLLVNRQTLQEAPSWPATFTYEWPFACKHGRCPTSNHSSLWEVCVCLNVGCLNGFHGFLLRPDGEGRTTSEIRHLR
ncbi:chitin deacetylase 7-like [Aplysia californica]|uniref:Chitin deacetylase 7-like n=1 Tax=Aplysia californica TaxID=6500 RepID=A0ABM1W2A3_APLCA|nr:chitin deacetylase 7-like [Aplysia californica]